MSDWVHVVLDLPPAQAEVGTAFWSAALGWPLGSPWVGSPELASFDPPAGDAYVHRQLVGAGAPAGVHVDLEVDDRDASERRLCDLGAALLRRTPDWTTLQTPGGFPFCLVDQSAHGSRPEPLTVGPGRRSRLAQICLDTPAGTHEAEVDFWRAATGWRWGQADREEFAGKLHPTPGSPVQLLLQRLGADDPGPARAHLDLAVDDLEAEVQRLVGLGAVRLHPGHGWVVLRDPAGLTFCVTANGVTKP